MEDESKEPAQTPPFDQLANKILSSWIEPADPKMSQLEKLQHIMDQVMPGIIGLKITSLSQNKISGSLALDKASSNVVSSMHGGAIFTLGDTLAGALLWANTDGEIFGTTKAASIQYFRPLRKGTLHCTAVETNRVDNPRDPKMPREIDIEAIMHDEASHQIAKMTMKFSMHRFKRRIE